MSEPRSSFSAIRDRRFGPYLAGNFTSNVGNWFQNVAAGIVVFQVTGSNTLVGTVSVVQFLATLFLAPWSGALADRFDRRKLLIFAQSVAAAGALGLAIWVGLEGVEGLPGVWPIFAATGVIGLGFAVGISAMNALIPSLVEPEDLDDAIALNSATFTLARAIGPALAGLTVAGFGAVWAFGVNALTFFPLILVLALIRPRPVRRSGGDGSVRAGFSYVRERRALLWLVLATLTVGWAGDPANTLSPGYSDMFGRGETFVGLQVAAFGAGAAVSSMVVGRIRSRIGLVATTKTGMILLVLGLVTLSAAPHEAVVLIAFFIAGTGFTLGVTTTNSNMQRRIDEDMRGRVMALWSMAFLGSRPIAGIVDGAIADLISPRAGVLAATAPLLVGWWAMSRVAALDEAGEFSAGREEVGPGSPP